MDIDNENSSLNANKISKQSNNEIPPLLDASDPTVLAKYKAGGIIANAALHKVLCLCKPGCRILELCKTGDEFIVNECNKVYPELKIRGQKGVAFPTCVSVNEVAGHYSPYADDTRRLHVGDLVKIDLGVHLDGFCAVVAHTICLGECSGMRANVLAAAWSGIQASLRVIKAHNKNSQVTLAIEKSANTFKCEPMDSVLSHEMRQYVIDHDNTIIAKETPDRKVKEFEFEHYQVFGIDIMMSTGRGKAIDRGEKCTIYKRNVEIEYPLKLKTSRELLKMVNKQYPTFPFTMRNFENNRCRLGITECVKHNLVQPYPILSEKSGDFVAQFKITVIIHPRGTMQVTGLPLDMSTVNPDHQIVDNELNNLLSCTFGGELPEFYNTLHVPNFNEMRLNSFQEEKTGSQKPRNPNPNQKNKQKPKRNPNQKTNKNRNKQKKGGNKKNQNKKNQNKNKNKNKGKNRSQQKQANKNPNANQKPKKAKMELD